MILVEKQTEDDQHRQLAVLACFVLNNYENGRNDNMGEILAEKKV